MKKKTREQMIALAMTAMVLLFLWLLAGWIKIHSHSSQLRRLTFSEGFEPVVQPAATYLLPESKPAPNAPVRNQPPEISEIFQTRDRVTAPQQRLESTTLEVKQQNMQLSVVDRSLRTSSDHLTAKARPNPSGSTDLRIQTDQLLLEHRQAPQRVAELRDRPDPSTSVLQLQTIPHREPSRVLKEESAQKIVQWMRIIPSDLPPGIQRHIEYQPGNLTSSATLEYDGVTWEIYLMARLPSEELHVVIVKGDQTYYVVDPSFKREGRRFRIGVARRSEGVITGIASEERAASSEDARLHYDVFLAWWDQLNVTLQ